MTTTEAIYAFLNGIQSRTPPAGIGPDDLALLHRLNLIDLSSADEYATLQRAVQQLPAAQSALAAEEQQRSQLAARVGAETAGLHSFRFFFEGHEAKEAQRAAAAEDVAAAGRLQADLSARERQYADLLAQKSRLDTMVPYGGGYVALTGAGQIQARDMAVRMYRVADLPFPAYIAQLQAVDGEMNALADRGAQFAAALGPPLARYDRSHVWSVALGLAQSSREVADGSSAFLAGWNGLSSLAHNDENRLLAAEVLAAIPRPIPETLAAVGPLESEVRRLGVAQESSLGVAAMLLLGRRADGTLATAPLEGYLRVTRSFEAAALLAIVNVPAPELTEKFQHLRALFGGWGFAPSEDVELASAYLAVSELPVEGIDTKLGIVTRGMGRYLQFPLVASAILASLPTLEANESLRLLEQAYEIVGRRAMPMSEPELICLALRVVHGIREQTIGHLDTTAAAPAAPTTPSPYLFGPRIWFVGAIVAHQSFYATFGGFAGAHPGHVNVMGGFGG